MPCPQSYPITSRTVRPVQCRYQLFGPKLIADCFRFQDEALESRCLTTEVPVLTSSDIPRIFPAEFKDEVHGLRSKLLTFRLYILFKLKGSELTSDLLEPGLPPGHPVRHTSISIQIIGKNVTNVTIVTHSFIKPVVFLTRLKERHQHFHPLFRSWGRPW